MTITLQELYEQIQYGKKYYHDGKVPFHIILGVDEFMDIAAEATEKMPGFSFESPKLWGHPGIAFP